MKLMIGLFFLMISNLSFAQYSCTSDTGTKLLVSDVSGMVLESPDISKYYRETQNVDIKKLVTIVEETEGVIFEENEDGYESLLTIENSEIFNAIWNVRLKLVFNNKGIVEVIDMNGATFSYTLDCLHFF